MPRSQIMAQERNHPLARAAGRGRPAFSELRKMIRMPSYSDPRPTQRLLDRGCHSILIVGEGHRPSSPTQFFGCISHDKGHAGEDKHFDVVVVITNGHDLLAGDATVVGPTLQCVAFGTSLVQYVDDGKVAPRIFRPEHGNVLLEVT